MNPPSAMAADTDNGLLNFLHTMSGPNFLWLFAVWFLITFGGVLLFRWNGRDTPATTIIGLTCFELLAVARLIDGSAHGLHKWTFLILMMIVGGVVFIIG